MSGPVTSFLALHKILKKHLRFLLLAAGLSLLPLLSVADDSLQSLFNFQTRMAGQGSSEAMIKLGEMCEEGLGTAQSDEHAREWYQRALEKGHPDAQSHLDNLKHKQERVLQEQAKAAKEQAAREEAAREQAANEEAAREQEARDKAAQEEAARREAAKAAMTPEEKARAREEAIRHAEEVYQQSLQKQLEKERAESEALKRTRNASSQ